MTKNILYLGRLSPTTKADLYPLLLVFKSLKERCDFKIKLILAGRVEPNEFYIHKEMIKELGLDYDVQLIINFDEDKKTDIISSAQLAVFPTDSFLETRGSAVQEVLDCGVPVLLSDIPCYSKFLDDGNTIFKIKTIFDEEITAIDCEDMEEKICSVLTRVRQAHPPITEPVEVLELTPDGENLIKGTYNLPPAHDFHAAKLNLDFLAKLLIHLSQVKSATAKEFIDNKFTILWAAKYRLLRLK